MSTMRRNQLSITPAPFKSSRLAVRPTPFTPRLPLNIPFRATSTPPTHKTPQEPAAVLDLPPQPPQPLKWLWQCHKCSRVYPLATTRRCLDDGHFFCAGTTVVRHSRRKGLGVGGTKIVRHKACASEFDYQGWKIWGDWRREVERLREEEIGARRVLTSTMDWNENRENCENNWLEDGAVEDEWDDPKFTKVKHSIRLTKSLAGGAWSSDLWSPTIQPRRPPALKPTPNIPRKDCGRNCDYPSECRWGPQSAQKQSVDQGAAIPAPQSVELFVALPTLPEQPPIPPELDEEAIATFDDILKHMISTAEDAEEEIGIQLEQQPSSSSVVSRSPPLDSSSEDSLPLGVVDEPQPSKQDVWASAKRRNRRSAEPVPSPLSSHPPVRG